MYRLLKESIFKFIFVVFFLLIINYFIKSLNLNILKIIVLAITVSCIDSLLRYIRNSEDKK